MYPVTCRTLPTICAPAELLVCTFICERTFKPVLWASRSRARLRRGEAGSEFYFSTISCDPPPQHFEWRGTSSYLLQEIFTFPLPLPLESSFLFFKGISIFLCILLRINPSFVVLESTYHLAGISPLVYILKTKNNLSPFCRHVPSYLTP